MKTMSSITLLVGLVAILAASLFLHSMGNQSILVGYAIGTTIGLFWLSRTVEAKARDGSAPPTTISAEWTNNDC